MTAVSSSDSEKVVEKRRTFSRVKRLECSACLVQEVLAMVVAEILCADDTVQISLEQFLYKVHCRQSNFGYALQRPLALFERIV